MHVDNNEEQLCYLLGTCRAGTELACSAASLQSPASLLKDSQLAGYDNV